MYMVGYVQYVQHVNTGNAANDHHTSTPTKQETYTDGLVGLGCYIVTVSFIGERNWSHQRKPQSRRKSLTNLITSIKPSLRAIQTHNVSGDRC